MDEPLLTSSHILALRAHTGLTQAQFAQAIGLSRAQYSLIERGYAPARKLHRMAMAAVVWDIADPADWDQ